MPNTQDRILHEMDDIRKLKEENIRLKSILENIRLPLILLDENKRILYASSEVGSWRKKKSSDVKECYCLKMAFGIEPCKTCVAQKALESGEIRSFVFRIKKNRNKDIFLKHTAIPITDANGEKRVLVVLTDENEKTSSNKNRAELAKISSAGEMSSVLAHGLRNSLTSLKMILQLLYESSTLNNSDRDSIYIALHSVLNMEKVVADFSKFYERHKPDIRKHDLNRIVNETVDFSRYKLNVEKIHISLETANDLEPVMIDETQFREALINLIFNAGEAMENGGKLLIRTYGRNGESNNNNNRTGFLEIGADRTEVNSAGNTTSTIVVEVEDNGKGISEDRISRIFDPFFTTKVNGMGLGLAMVKRIIEDHHGRISVESGSWGSKFILEIPRGLIK
jgi:signal transduction histidine kinase